MELASVRVNAVSPGVVRTNLWQDMPTEDREKMNATIGGALPVGRVSEASDIAKAYPYLMQEGFGTADCVRRRYQDGRPVRW